MSRGPLILSVDPESLWQISQAELKKRGFRLDRVDRRSGIIETFRTTSGQWFEFWRRDTAGPDALAESSLRTIRRSVRLEISSVPLGQYRLRCIVTVEKLSTEPTFISGRVRARTIFSGAAGRVPGLGTGQKNEQQTSWVPLGRDPALESDILESIKNTLNHGI